MQITSHALIDTGALIVGKTNEEVAVFLSDKLDREFQGVVFFQEKEGWLVLERNGRRLPLGQSSVCERDAFVYFDESHCRGADMKLKPTAHAVITLGPLMCKDKFMQGAGRLRLLGSKSQRLTIAIIPETCSNIHQILNQSSTDEISVRDVLQWVFDNTVFVNRQLMPSWIVNGAHYVESQLKRMIPLESEVVSLADLYGGPCKSGRFIDIARSSFASLQTFPETSRLKIIQKEIFSRCERWETSSVTTSHHSLEEECEREREQEREQEKEVEEEKLTFKASQEGPVVC